MTEDEIVVRIACAIPDGSKCKNRQYCPFHHFAVRNGNKSRHYCWLMDETHEDIDKRCGINIE